jgi:hypothetical protein
MKKDQREQSEWFFFTRQEDQVINVLMIAELILTSFFCFRRINHMVIKPFAVILCAIHHATNNLFSLRAAPTGRVKDEQEN